MEHVQSRWTLIRHRRGGWVRHLVPAVVAAVGTDRRRGSRWLPDRVEGQARRRRSDTNRLTVVVVKTAPCVERGSCQTRPVENDIAVTG